MVGVNEYRVDDDELTATPPRPTPTPSGASASGVAETRPERDQAAVERDARGRSAQPPRPTRT